MRNARSYTVLSGLLALVAAGCSGGGTDSTASVKIRCIDGQSFCVISCDLGCSQTGCSVTEIAENQRLRFVFSDRVDPASVNNASISIRTVSGVAPDGEFHVNDREVTFVPRVRTVNGVSTFGFLRNESYILTLAGGASAAQGVRSVAGDALTRELSCTVVASRGILDEDLLPPSVTLVSPTNVSAAPTNPTIVLRFSELIDTTPLSSPLSNASPIRVVLRGRTPTGDCDRDAEGTALEGIPQVSTEIVGTGDTTHEVSVVSFQSPVQLPGNACITVYVTADLRDLSGRAAVPATFEILTVAGISVPITITEQFNSNSGFDPFVSGGTWSNGARPAALGGDGRHGSFNYLHGSSNAAGEFEFNNDSFLVTAARSLTGLEYLITDGRYFFTDFVVPEGIKVRFTGVAPAQIFVRGQVDIRGTIDISGADMPFWVPTTGPAAGQRTSNFNATVTAGNVAGFSPGQPGGAPGCGGGRGGQGAEECESTGPLFTGAQPRFDGRPGENVRLLAGHAYAASAANTGGRGGILTPASGLTVNTPLMATLYRPQFSLGGTGGGFMLAGGVSVNSTPPLGALPTASSPAGLVFPLLPFPSSPPANYQSLNHYLVGGSGGGGGGSHPFGTQGFLSTATVPPNVYLGGHGGTGGGGALAVRSGGDFSVAAGAILRSKGGAGVLINGDNPGSPTIDITFGVSSPGGGGSGGSFLLQSATTLNVAGSIDTAGSLGSRTGSITPAGLNLISNAGAGSSGFYRLEAPASAVAFSGTGTPAYSAAVNSGALTDRDTASGCTSTWRSTGQFFPPVWERYELDVDTDGDGVVDVTFTDSGAPGTQKANDPAGPVTIMFQGARLNQAGTEPLPGEIKQWREGIGTGAGPGIGLDSPNGFRFMLTFNTGLFPNAVVKALRVFAST